MISLKTIKQKYRTHVTINDLLVQLKMLGICLNGDEEFKKLKEEVKEFSSTLDVHANYDADIFKSENYCTYTFYKDGELAKKYAIIYGNFGHLYDIVSLHNLFNIEQECALKHISYFNEMQSVTYNSIVSLNDISLDVTDQILSSLTLEENEKLVC